MAVQKRVVLLASGLISFVTFRYAPRLALFPASFFWNVATLYLIFSLSQICWAIVVYPLLLSPLRHLPQPPDSSILLGHFKRIYKDPTGEPQRDWIDTVPNDGVLYYRWLFNESRVLITTPKALAEVLVQRNYEFIKPQRIRLGLGRLLGVGILLAEGDEHKRQRKALMPAFSFRHIKNLYPVFWDKSRELTLAMSAAIKADPEQTNVVEIRDWASRATLDIIGVAGMGQDFNAISDPQNTLNTTYRTIFSPGKSAQYLQLLASQLPQWLLMALPLKRNEEIGSAIKTIKAVAAGLIRAKRAKMEKGGETELDILSVALESGGFSDEDLVNQLMTFLAAGHETTASAMTWAVYLLCKHPEVQTRLREEIRTQLPALSNPATQISSTDIDSLSYLNAVLNETMRIFPPVPLTLRETAHDTTIQGHFIPAATTIVICPWAVNTSEALWGPDAREFNPDRWMGAGKANTGGADSNYATTTFLHGPRSCIGKDFAKAEFACLMAALVGRFDLEFEDPNWKLQIQGGITARPKGGLKIRIREVEGW
ncbi:cytochrome P450 [Melanomma pulvis-pyrius CBS 109.77]|uniref:Cytochrome P450 n=1 Tax=Melanomma pulvis-pyrius CBS 109.77 TaxID=1314802 RepID=A0A6A6XH94_9PLEO|nr:cytochrome P450 [Melanomma pulvis-pyrius CBS 109.77]